jgi:hypothetical protein
MVLYEPMQMAAVGSCKYNRLADERFVADQIEQMLERAGVGGSIDRCSDDQRVGSLDRSNDGLAGRACLGSGQAGEDQRGGIDHFDRGQPMLQPTGVSVGAEASIDGSHKVAYECGRSRGASDAT